MTILRRIGALNLRRSICLLVAVSFVIWFVLGIYSLSHTRLPEKPGPNSGHPQWRMFREDDPDPELKSRPPLMFGKLLQRENQSPFVSIMQQEAAKIDPQNETGTNLTPRVLSLREKLEKFHHKKLDEAGFKVDLDGIDKMNNPKQPHIHDGNEPNPMFDQFKRLHQNKLNKAGFDVQFNPKVPNVVMDSPEDLPPINYDVHVFYYPWYGSPEFNGRYYHWNHPFLPHWNKAESLKWPLGIHKPPHDVGANFYPALGPYSSSDPEVVSTHMSEIRGTGAGVVCVSWYPPNDADKEGTPPDNLMPLILATAAKYNLKVAFHIEAYTNRNHKTLRESLKYIMKTYGHHPALYRRKHKGRQLPVYYIYDSYLVQSKDWAKLFKPDGEMSVRATEIDGVFIALLAEKKHRVEIVNAGFDGYYTYFASNGFTYGSTWRNWGIIQAYARSKGLMFVPSVGPGYVDTRVRPWNAANTKSRDQGKYYEMSFESAVNVGPPMISITSYNEWHEGTQIESAVSKTAGSYPYEDYEPGGQTFYLTLTKRFVTFFSSRQKHGVRDL